MNAVGWSQHSLLMQPMGHPFLFRTQYLTQVDKTTSWNTGPDWVFLNSLRAFLTRTPGDLSTSKSHYSCAAFVALKMWKLRTPRLTLLSDNDYGRPWKVFLILVSHSIRVKHQFPQTLRQAFLAHGHCVLTRVFQGLQLQRNSTSSHHENAFIHLKLPVLILICVIIFFFTFTLFWGGDYFFFID